MFGICCLFLSQIQKTTASTIAKMTHYSRACGTIIRIIQMLDDTATSSLMSITVSKQNASHTDTEYEIIFCNL